MKKEPATLLDRARAYVEAMAPAVSGDGGDKQTFKVACRLVEFGLKRSEAETLMNEYNARCQPSWSAKAIERKLKCAFRKAKPNPKYTTQENKEAEEESKLPPLWPKPSECARSKAIAKVGIGLSDLAELSPIRFELPNTYAVLQILFPGDPLICVGKSSSQFWTRKLSRIGARAEFVQFIVPSPMSKQWGKIQDPDSEGPFWSEHTKDNTGDRRFAVIEFDTGTSDDHASLLWHLSDFYPLIMAVHSGGRSLHGWFYVPGEPEQEINSFYRYAVWLGADRATHLKSQFVRMPDGRRDNGNRQSIHYFNPSPIK